MAKTLKPATPESLTDIASEGSKTLKAFSQQHPDEQLPDQITFRSGTAGDRLLLTTTKGSGITSFETLPDGVKEIIRSAFTQEGRIFDPALVEVRESRFSRVAKEKEQTLELK